MFDHIEGEIGPVALVNNAGVAMPGDFLNFDLDAPGMININLRGVFVALQRAGRPWSTGASRARSST